MSETKGISAVDVLDEMNRIVKEHPSSLACSEDGRYVWPERWQALRKWLSSCTPIVKPKPVHAADCSAGQWVSCDDAFPVGTDEVLVWDGDQVFTFLPETGDIPEHEGPARCKRFGITHWMPLPQPPERPVHAADCAVATSARHACDGGADKEGGGR